MWPRLVSVALHWCPFPGLCPSLGSIIANILLLPSANEWGCANSPEAPSFLQGTGFSLPAQWVYGLYFLPPVLPPPLPILIPHGLYPKLKPPEVPAASAYTFCLSFGFSLSFWHPGSLSFHCIHHFQEFVLGNKSFQWHICLPCLLSSEY